MTAAVSAAATAALNAHTARAASEVLAAPPAINPSGAEILWVYLFGGCAAMIVLVVVVNWIRDWHND